MADEKKGGVAVGKRVRMTKMQQHIILAVLIASVITGASIVFSIYFVKYINFNERVMAEKSEAISNYNQTIKNVGICGSPSSKNADGTVVYTDQDLAKCQPELLNVETLSGTLRYNVMVGMANNVNLESVAREITSGGCYGEGGKRIDFVAEYSNARTTEDRANVLEKMKVCSSLRVVPDALPAKENVEALLASLNQLFLLYKNKEPISLSPAGGAISTSISGVYALPVNLRIEETAETTTGILDNVERSIRTFDVSSATLTWAGQNDEGVETTLELSASAQAYFTTEMTVAEEEVTVRATDKKKTSSVAELNKKVTEEASKTYDKKVGN